jgi:Protein of unknown function (DUF1376).
MKWVKFDPAAFNDGVIGLSFEERGAYITLISLQYARAPAIQVTDELVIRAAACRPQVWRRIKKSLITKGKVRETDGKLTANRVEDEVKTALKLMAGQQTGTKLARNHPDTRSVSAVAPSNINDFRGGESTSTTRLKRSKKDSGEDEGSSPDVVDVRTRLFRQGLATLQRITGKQPKQCRTLIGKWLRDAQDDAVRVCRAIEDAEINQVADPVSWIMGALGSRIAHGGHSNDGMAQVVAAFQSERRKQS